MQNPDDLIKLSDPGEIGREDHNRVDRIVVSIANLFAWAFPLLMIAIVAQVFLRASGVNQAWLDDLQWWIYGGSALVAIGYAVTTNSHVRVDIFHENFSAKKKARIEIFALTWLFLPFVILTFDITIPYALQSISNDEGSSSPNGLHNLWLLKTFVCLTFLFIMAATWAAYVRQLKQLVRPTLWRQLLWAFPSTMFIVNLLSYYGIWWFLRLTNPGEDVSNRDIGRMPVFDEFEFGVHDIKYTVVISLVLTLLVLGVTRLMDRSGKAEG